VIRNEPQGGMFSPRILLVLLFDAEAIQWIILVFCGQKITCEQKDDS
jgi:hypothetical protein